MSITAKQYLLKQLSGELGGTLTQDDLSIVQDKLNNVLSMFDVETVDDGETDIETSEYLVAF